MSQYPEDDPVSKTFFFYFLPFLPCLLFLKLIQESGNDEDESRKQWEADKPLSERLKVTWLYSYPALRHCSDDFGPLWNTFGHFRSFVLELHEALWRHVLKNVGLRLDVWSWISWKCSNFTSTKSNNLCIICVYQRLKKVAFVLRLVEMKSSMPYRHRFYERWAIPARVSPTDTIDKLKLKIQCAVNSVYDISLQLLDYMAPGHIVNSFSWSPTCMWSVAVYPTCPLLSF